MMVWLLGLICGLVVIVRLNRLLLVKMCEGLLGVLIDGGCWVMVGVEVSKRRVREKCMGSIFG